MYLKLLRCESIRSYKAITQTRLTNHFQVVVLSRNLSTFKRNDKYNVSACYGLRFQNGSTAVLNSLIVRHQSSKPIEEILQLNKPEPVSASVETEAVQNVAASEAASSQTTAQWVSDTGEVIPDIPTPLPVEEIVQALSINGEPTFASLGLCNYTPVGGLQWIMEYMHVSFDLPWWATIALCTLTLRLMMFPLMIRAQRAAADTTEHMPKIQYLTQKMTEARRHGDMYEASLYGQELGNYMKKHKFNPLRSMIMPMVQAPVFLSFFLSLRKMAEHVDSLSTGGALWFTDLTAYDPYYGLPLITSATLFLTLEVGSDSVSVKYMSPLMRTGLRLLPVIIFPFMMHFQGAVLVYWVSNNFISLGQVSLLKIPAVREYFKIPVKQAPAEYLQKTKLSPKGFKKGFTEAISNFKIAKQIRERESFDAMNFRQAGKGPLRKTFDFNPKAVQSKPAIESKQRH